MSGTLAYRALVHERTTREGSMTLLTGSTELFRSRVRDAADRVRSAVHWSVVHGLSRAVARAAARQGDLQGRLIVGASGGAAVWDVIEDIRAAGRLPRGRLAYLTADHAVCREVLSSPDFRSIDIIRTFGRFAPL